MKEVLLVGLFELKRGRNYYSGLIGRIYKGECHLRLTSRIEENIDM